MYQIHKKILSDEKMHPIAVQIDYKDWLKIEKDLQFLHTKKKKIHMTDYFNTIELTEDPLKYQKKIRDEWE